MTRTQHLSPRQGQSALAALFVASALLSGCPTPIVDDAGADTGGLDTRPLLDGGPDAGRDTPAMDVPPGPECGDGNLEGTEACDDGNTAAGDGCDASCAAETGWVCDGASPTLCIALCGDGMVVGEEAGANGCDDGDTTAGDGCSDICAVEPGYSCAGAPSVCMTGCGDGAIAGSEACDDGDSNDLDGCSAACVIETGWTCTGMPSACLPTCGDGALVGTEACDDGDTTALDGCSDLCVVETGFTCDGAPSLCVAECGDGVVASIEGCDDGNDRSFDGCHANCVSEMEIEPNEDGTPSVGGTGPQGNDFDATAVANADRNGAITDAFVMTAAFGVAGDEDVFAYRNGSALAQSVTFAVFADATGVCGATLDPSITVRDAAGAQLGRDDNSGPDRCPLLTFTVPAGGTVYVHVTEFGDNATGDYVLSVALCTDGIVGGSEVCDDGNTVSGDGCDNNCRVSACGNGFVAGTEVCDDGNLVNGDGCDSNCVPSGCGNGVRGPGEACDDGNLTNGDGCDDNCTVSACGNGALGPTETCDDGNVVDADGCDSNCRPTGCPNGVRTGTELCDDGNMTNADGCDNDCTVASTCGNGTVQSFETCDDGARVAGDGCSPICQRETGYACSGAPSTCAPICGDSRVIPPEICDDGNLIGGDACEADCRSSLCPSTDVEPNGTRATASCVNLRALATGSIGVTGDQDYWTFSLTTVADVRIETTDLSGTGCSVDTFIDLYNSAGMQIVGDNDDGTNNCSLIDPATDAAVRNLPAGVYYVRTRFSSVDATGDYAMRITSPACGDGVRTGIEQCDDGNLTAGDGCTATCTVEFDLTVDGTGVPLAIPDSTPAGVTSPAMVTTACTVVSAAVTFTSNHTFSGDLIIELVSPTGTRIRLSNRQGGVSSLLGPYTFLAGGSVWPGAGDPIATGSYAASALSTLAGQNGMGMWQLFVSDSATLDTGSLTSWRLSLDCM
jgi:cysteine-rich repeat protein